MEIVYLFYTWTKYMACIKRFKYNMGCQNDKEVNKPGKNAFIQSDVKAMFVVSHNL